MGRFHGVQDIERTREGVAVLMRDVWHNAVIDFVCLALEPYELSSSFQGLNYV